MSGSQPWNGKIGALTTKAATKPRKIQLEPLKPDGAIMSNDPCEIPSTTIEASISSEPVIV